MRNQKLLLLIKKIQLKPRVIVVRSNAAAKKHTWQLLTWVEGKALVHYCSECNRCNHYRKHNGGAATF